MNQTSFGTTHFVGLELKVGTNKIALSVKNSALLVWLASEIFMQLRPKVRERQFGLIVPLQRDLEPECKLFWELIVKI